MIAAMLSSMSRHHASTGVATAGSLLATIGLSGFPAWVAVITGAGAFFGLAALRSTASLWRGERNAERAKAQRLEDELNNEKLAHDKTRHRLEASEAKPDIEKLYDLMRAHDERMATTSREIAKALQEVSSNLSANTSALTLWATEQAKNI